MHQFVSWEVATKENKWQGRNITRWQNEEYDKHLQGRRRASSIRSSARRCSSSMNDLRDQRPRRDPGRRTGRGVAAMSSKLRRRDQRLGQRHLGHCRTGTGRREAAWASRSGSDAGHGALPARRLLIAIPSLLGISVVLFTVLALAPGDPFEELATNPNVPPEVRADPARQVRPRRPGLAALPALARRHAAGRLGLLVRQPHRRRHADPAAPADDAVRDRLVAGAGAR